MFRDIPPLPPLPLKRPDIEEEYDDTFLLPPRSPTVEALKTNFDSPITNQIDKTNNVIEIASKSEKQDRDKFELHLSEQLSKPFPEVENGGGKYISQEDNNNYQKLTKLPILELTDVLTKINESEVPRQLEFFDGGQNKEFEKKLKTVGLSTGFIEFLEFLQSSFCQ